MKLTLDTLARYCTECGDCLHWRQGVNGQGYPQAKLDDRVWLVRRYVYTVLMGKPLRPRQPVVARCNSKLCVSPQCLCASSFAAVQAKAYKHGRRSGPAEYMNRLRKAQRQGLAKLDWDKVQQIRAMPDTMSGAQIGRLFGVSGDAVNAVRRGRTWRAAMPASSVFSYARGGAGA